MNLLAFQRVKRKKDKFNLGDNYLPDCSPGTYFMNISLIDQDIQRKMQSLHNLECSLLYLRQDQKKHEEAIDLIGHEVFYLKDQLFNCKMLFNILLAEQGPIDEMQKPV